MCYLLRSFPSSRAGPTAEGGTGAHVCVGDRPGPRLWAGMEAILLTETFARSGSAAEGSGPRPRAGAPSCSHHPPRSRLGRCWESLAGQGRGWLRKVTLSCRLTLCQPLQPRRRLSAGTGLQRPSWP